MSKRKSVLTPQNWVLVNCNWGVQICEGNRVIVAISELSSADEGPHRSEDVMERANLLMSIPALTAENARLREALKTTINNCDNCDNGVIECYPEHSASAYNGVGDPIFEYFPCPYCSSARAALNGPSEAPDTLVHNVEELAELNEEDLD